MFKVYVLSMSMFIFFFLNIQFIFQNHCSFCKLQIIVFNNKQINLLMTVSLIHV